MKDTASSRLSPSSSPAKRFLGIVAVFALLGPAVGTLSVSMVLAMAALSAGLAEAGLLAQGKIVLGSLLLGSVFGLPLAYLIGAVPAAAVGLAVALWERWRGSLPLGVPLGLALVLGLLAASRAGGFGTTDPAPAAPLGLLIAYLAGALVCWLVVRSMPTPPDNPAPGRP